MLYRLWGLLRKNLWYQSKIDFLSYGHGFWVVKWVCTSTQNEFILKVSLDNKVVHINASHSMYIQLGGDPRVDLESAEGLHIISGLGMLGDSWVGSASQILPLTLPYLVLRTVFKQTSASLFFRMHSVSQCCRGAKTEQNVWTKFTAGPQYDQIVQSAL